MLKNLGFGRMFIPGALRQLLVRDVKIRGDGDTGRYEQAEGKRRNCWGRRRPQSCFSGTEGELEYERDYNHSFSPASLGLGWLLLALLLSLPLKENRMPKPSRRITAVWLAH